MCKLCKLEQPGKLERKSCFWDDSAPQHFHFNFNCHAVRVISVIENYSIHECRHLVTCAFIKAAH